MTDRKCIEFLQWSLPQLRLRWKGFRKVRSQVCKRIKRRIKKLGLSGFHTYQNYLIHHPPEWEKLDSFCYITISRFYRDRAVWENVRHDILPELKERAVRKGQAEL